MASDNGPSQRQPYDEPPRANALQIVTTFIGAVFVVTLVLYGLNNQRDENETTIGGEQAVAAIPANPEPSAGSQQDKQQPRYAQAQQDGGQQPTSPSSSDNQPSAASNPSSTISQPPNPQATTTGQGPNPQGSPGSSNTGNKAPANAVNNNANPSLGNASPSVQPSNPANNQ